METAESSNPKGRINGRPLSVTIIAALFLITGGVGLAYHLTELRLGEQFPSELLWVCLVRLLAVIAAVFLFRGCNWARWLLVLWMAYHVVLSIFHSPWQLLVHALFLAVLVYLLFRASAYFEPATDAAPGLPR